MHKHPLLSLLGLLLTLAILTPRAFSQAPAPTLFFRPHCTLQDQTACTFFLVQDPLTLRSNDLQVGDTLDVDLVLANTANDPINKARIWISYDTAILEGKELTVSPFFPVVAPGENLFAGDVGYAKISASTTGGAEPKDLLIPIARLTFTVKQAPPGGQTPIAFYDVQPGPAAHTFVSISTAPDANILQPPIGSLLVSVPSAASSASSLPAPLPVSSSSAGASSAPAAPVPVPDSGNFSIIQVQNVRVSTRGSELFVTWDPLSTPKLQGYTIYYGTQPGRYVQRRNVSLAARGTVIRDLPMGTTYYVAVRGVDDMNVESAFSNEASVEIGNAATSTSPITGALDIYDDPGSGDIAPQNPLENPDVPLTDGVPGSSGLPSALALLLFISAVAGTFLAFRRQYAALIQNPRA